MRKLIYALILALLPVLAMAQSQYTPTGKWKTFDEKTGAAKSIVEVYKQQDGTLSARVLTVLQSDKGPNPVCDACKGSRHNQPIEGMEIMWGVQSKGESWGNGKILDPKNGKVYSVKLRPIDEGKKLEVRGFMGISALGRTQVWERQFH